MNGDEPHTSEAQSGPFWSPPITVDQAELNPAILRQIETCADARDFRAYHIQVFADRVGPPEAMFEIAFNDRTGRACAIYAAICEPDISSGQKSRVSTDPIWVTAATPRSAIDVFFQALVEQSVDE